MAFAPARVAPAVAQRLQIPVQVLLYVGLFIFAQYLVNRWQVPLPANLVGMVMLLLLKLQNRKRLLKLLNLLNRKLRLHNLLLSL